MGTLLTFENGPWADHEIRLERDQAYVVGSRDSDIDIEDPSVSTRHAVLHVGRRGVTVTAADARVVTSVNGRRLLGSQTAGDGDRLGFGDVTAVLSARSARHGPAALAVALVAVAMIAVVLFVVSGDGGGGPDAKAGDEVTATAEPVRKPARKPPPPPDPFALAAASTLEIDNQAGQSRGSGWVMSREGELAYVVTNEHVVRDGERFTARLDDGEPAPAELVGASGCDDLAVLKVPWVDGMQVLEIGPDPKAGDKVLVAGYPRSLADTSGLVRREMSVSRVDVTYTGADRDVTAVYRNLIALDGRLIPGDSGGPVLDARTGSVVGVDTLRDEDLGYSIAASRVAAVVKHLKTGLHMPGLGLKYVEASTPPTITRVDMKVFSDNGFAPGQTLRTVDGRQLGSDVESTPRAVCALLGTLGNDIGEPTRFGARKPDGRSVIAFPEF